MSKYIISINQLADFFNGTDAKKRSIIRQQKTPNTFKVSYYQLAKARIKKSLANNGDIDPILKGIDELKNRKPEKKRQINDRIVSLEAMQRFITMQIPSLLKDSDYEIIKKVDSKSVIMNGVEVIISPDLIIKTKINDRVLIGGIKLHISKGNKFDIKQQSIVANMMSNYLKNVVAKKDEIVMPELCLSLDLFGYGIISAFENTDNALKDIEVICEEIKIMWSAA